MKRKKIYILLFILAISGLQFSSFHKNSPTGKSFKYQLAADSKISISGSSNVNEFICSTCQEYFPAEGIMSVNETTNQVSFQFTSINIPVKSVNCDNHAMEFDMSKALRSDIFPYITLTIRQVTSIDKKPVSLSKPTSLLVIADLRIAGKTKTQNIKITGSSKSASSLYFYGTHTFKLTDFDIDPPTALFGVIKVKDDITINFDLKINLL